MARDPVKLFIKVRWTAMNVRARRRLDNCPSTQEHRQMMWCVIELKSGYSIEPWPCWEDGYRVAIVAACPTRLAARAAMRLLNHPDGNPELVETDAPGTEENP